MKTLSEYAKENRIHYRTAWNAYKAGKIPDAFKNEFGKVLIPDEFDKRITRENISDDLSINIARLIEVLRNPEVMLIIRQIIKALEDEDN